MAKKTVTLSVVVLLFVFLSTVPQARASIVDMATSSGLEAWTDGGVYFTNAISVINVGTGNFDPFLTLSDKNIHGTPFVKDGIEEAYNTSGRIGAAAPMDADNTASREKDMLLSDVPIVTLGSTDYYEFLLDINQSGSEGGVLLSLNDVYLYVSGTGLLTYTSFAALDGALAPDFYDLSADTYDDGGGSTAIMHVALDAGLTSGSGGGVVDLGMYVPTSLFSSVTDPSTTYLYMYTQFGDPEAANDGFEEWGIRVSDTPYIPEPATMALFGLGLAGAFIRRRRRK